MLSGESFSESMGGEVANAAACKAVIHGFDPHPVLQNSQVRHGIVLPDSAQLDFEPMRIRRGQFVMKPVFPHLYCLMSCDRQIGPRFRHAQQCESCLAAGRQAFQALRQRSKSARDANSCWTKL